MEQRSEAALVLLTLAFITVSAFYGLSGRAPAASYSVRTERRPTTAQLQEAALSAASYTEEEAQGAIDFGLVDLNTAGVDKLMTLPGVNEALARKIVDFRVQNGFFTQPDELYLIDGVDTALFEDIREWVFCSMP